MKTGGIIESINGDKITVKLFKEMGCSHCSACGEGNKFAGEYIFTSDKELYVGQEITFEIDDKTILSIGLFVYVFPLLVFFLAYYISTFFTDKEGVKILSSFVGLILSFLIINLFDKGKGKDIVKNIEIIDKAYTEKNNTCNL